ncbi:MAG: hypothetical protein LBR92_01980 [Puniceicoccales bacterium]|jgi:23S rRNA-/tRNA-specific pseudouridylate synthase|nr:hypothetical protein [Puniceicoccales bacterium]
MGTNIIVITVRSLYLGMTLDFHFTLKTVADAEDWCVFEKPIGIDMEVLLAMKLSLFSPIYRLDSELSGIILCAKNKNFYNELRNGYGSEAMTFHFTILAQNDVNLLEEIVCDLPIAQHRERDCMIISHTTGKKARTIFKKIATLEQFTLWSAETKFLRKHQIRLHAHEMGIKILGEDIYDKIPTPFLSDFKSNVKSNRKRLAMPLYSATCVCLPEINFFYGGSDIKIRSPLPSKFASMLKIIKKWN